MNTMESGISTAASIADQGHRILTTVQRDALTGVTAGTMIYNSTLSQVQVYTGSTWVNTLDVTKPSPYQSIQRLAYQTSTSSYTTATTVPASAANVFATSLAFTADGTSSYLFEMYSPRVSTSALTNDFISMVLFDVGGAASVGVTGFVQTPVANSNSTALHVRLFVTPTAGSKTYNMRFVHGSSAGVAYAGSGGTTNTSFMPMFMAIYGPPIV
jgi:hypothetical protein